MGAKSARLEPAAAKRVAVILALLALSMGCTLNPAWKELAGDGNLDARWIDTGRFRHLVLANAESGQHLRIYVEGDGSPWIVNTRISVDPTPSNPVLLRLMHDASHAAIYLGRPCYFGSATDKNCSNRFWTLERYDDAVVSSMCTAANALIDESNAKTVQLIGYSGGGAIVIGMIGCTKRLVSITTIAGNLDPKRWASHHGYSPLNEIPASDPSVSQSKNIRETHWQCANDQNVPPFLTDTYFAAHPGADRQIVSGCSHASGWERYWSEIVE